MDTLTEDEVDVVLAGRLPEHHPEVASLVSFTAGLLAERRTAPPMGPMLRDQLAEAARQAVRHRRRLHVAGSIARAAAATVVVAGLLGAGASRQVLPGGLQDVVSSTASVVGVELPRADDPARGDGARTSGDRRGNGNGAASSDDEGKGAHPPAAAGESVVPADETDHGRGPDDHPSQGGPKGDEATTPTDEVSPDTTVTTEATAETVPQRDAPAGEGKPDPADTPKKPKPEHPANDAGRGHSTP